MEGAREGWDQGAIPSYVQKYDTILWWYVISEQSDVFKHLV